MLTWILIATLFLATTVPVLVAVLALRQLTRPPESSPQRFIEQGGAAPGERTLVCLGASIVHGRASVDFVDLLAKRFAGRGLRLVNAGVNGDVAAFVLKRLTAVIACRPDAVAVLVGTNDIQMRMSEAIRRRYERTSGSKEAPTLEGYIETVRRILTRLKAETRARVTLVSLPPMGEDLTSEANQEVRRTNRALQQLAEQEGARYLAVYDRMAAYLEEHGGARGRDYDGSTGNILGAIARRYVLRQSFDAISEHNGMLLLTDTLHLNSRAAAMVADAVEGFLLEG